MKIILNDTERALVQYIAQHRPYRSRFVLEYAKYSGMHRSDVKQLLKELLQHRVLWWEWDGNNAATKRYYVPTELERGWREC